VTLLKRLSCNYFVSKSVIQFVIPLRNQQITYNSKAANNILIVGPSHTAVVLKGKFVPVFY
jgi:hypothetical protein